jgi:Zn-dependent metalloprotease
MPSPFPETDVSTDFDTQHAQIDTHTSGRSDRTADYLMEEDTWSNRRTGIFTGIRSLSNPESFGDPDHYTRRDVGSQDNGGVHSNSGIPNHAFYLTPSATFAQARQGTLRAASELYGDSSAAFRAVQQAWTAVGVN